jgi:hypothetical protein
MSTEDLRPIVWMTAVDSKVVKLTDNRFGSCA